MNEITQQQNLNKRNNIPSYAAMGIATAATGTAFGIGKTLSTRGKYKKISQMSSDAFQNAKLPRALKSYKDYTQVTAVADYITKSQFKKLPARILGFSAIFGAAIIGAKVVYNQNKDKIQGFLSKFQKNKPQENPTVEIPQNQPLIEQKPVSNVVKSPEDVSAVVSSVLSN